MVYLLLTAITCACVMLGSGIAYSQVYPSRPVRIVASEAGGGGDLAARIIAQGLSASLGQPVVIENRGGGVFAGELVARAAADGYTLLLYANTLWLLPLMRSHLPYDPLRDFLPITLIGRGPNIMVVHPALPAKTVAEVIALAKARPGELNFGSAAAGTSNHLSAELFKYMAGINLIRVPYKGSASAFNALMAGQVQVFFATVAAVTPHLKSNRLRALAVTSLEPSLLLPELPTMTASGLPGFESVSVYGIFAPARTAAAMINRLNSEITGVLKRADVRERFFGSGVEVVGSTPAQLGAAMKDEIARMGKVITAAGIRDE